MAPKRLGAIALVVGLLSVVPAAAADPAPFGHPCTPQGSTLFCPTASDADRVPAFDGVPLDVDVTLPATGQPPYPTLVMLHALGGDKLMLESDTVEGTRSRSGLAIAGPASLDHYNNQWFARRGIAVVNPSSRGWGRSCGKRDSRTPDCARGWLHFLDQRYEARDVQDLLGKLVDEGIARPDRLGVTGISMGGGVAVRLAFLNDRMRMPDGSFAPWLSPAGTPLHFAGVFARWGAGSALSVLPNGRPFGATAQDPGTNPLGVLKQSALDFLYSLANTTGFVAPPGTDATADFGGWRAAFSKGEPYGAAAKADVAELADFHSAFSALGATTPPLLLEAGYADDITGTLEVLRVYRRLLAADTGPVALQLGDVGHFRASNPPATVRALNTDGAAFLEAALVSGAKPLPNGSVSAYPMACPGATQVAPLIAPTFDRLAKRTLRLSTRDAHVVTSKGGSAALAFGVTPRLGGATSCATFKKDRSSAVASFSWPTRGATLVGAPTVSASIRAHGADGQLAVRLWDQAPSGTQRLVVRGVYRVTKSQHGRIRIPLGIGYYRFAARHRIRLELLGRDPGFLRPSNGRFAIQVAKPALSLPVL